MGKPPAKKTSQEVAAEADSDESQFATEIAKRVAQVVGRDKANIVTAQVVSLFSERFSGPIAHPRHLREYEDICPGAADRIISMAESSLNHQKDMDTTIVNGQITDMKDGRWYGFLALIALILSALVCALIGKDGLALAFLGTGAVGTVGAFIKGKQKAS